MPKTTDKAIKVKTNIEFGIVSSAQKLAWRKFWQKLIVEVKSQ